MRLATTLSLATLRGPVPLAKALVALDILSEGRVIAGVGPGSSRLDYEAAGVPFEERWPRFEEAVGRLRALLRPQTEVEGSPSHSPPPAGLSPSARQDGGIPIWIGSWGSIPGLRRVARLGDGWLASAYNTTPEEFTTTLGSLSEELERRGRSADAFPHALVTMWAWVTDDRAEADRMIADVLAPIVRRDPAELRGRICVGSAEECADLLSRYAQAGCRQVQFWTLGDERRQIERLAGEVIPRIP
ncbi:MAG TPA: LLM class flavin-dependent oxidoreductase [Candidatus Dormibacteraeota bacterium]|jgi:alkanesulfonate monooxygenase SsuD/methylene tetrahydromethanopterin reductase-like flavin-dependent oxidoreductase (luciferase family)|nr:LLM class flavin-dependent oxidoreductase [Candidatus Dormibacteraeota bacterium]